MKKIKKIFISYGDSKYFIHRKRIAFQAKSFSFFDHIQIYNRNDISKEFSEKYKYIFNQKKGGGYFIWKIFMILEQLNNMEEQDILLYVDSGCTLNKNGKDRLVEYFDMLHNSNKSMLLFRSPNLIEREWATSEALNFFNFEKDSIEATSTSFIATAYFIKKTDFSIKFFQEYLNIINSDNNLITDFYANTRVQENYFKAHRWDQTILSLMSKKHNNYLEVKDETYFLLNPDEQYVYPILAVRDSIYTTWQKMKYLILYPLNIRKVIFFGREQFYFKRTPLLIKFYKKLLLKFKN